MTWSGRLSEDNWCWPDWPAAPGVRAVCTTRRGPGVSSGAYSAFNLGARCGDDAAAVAANRAALVAALGLATAPQWIHQVHGSAVHVCPGQAQASCADSEPEADALIASSAGKACAILSADCLPLLVAADSGAEVAAIHAGWRGLSGGVIESCIERLRTPREHLLVWLAPAIGPRAYEVGTEVRDAFLAHSSDASLAFRPTRPGHWLCDLYALARQRLAALGVTRIYGGEHCTLGDPQRFFSHRRDGVSGRMASLIWIEAGA